MKNKGIKYIILFAVLLSSCDQPEVETFKEQLESATKEISYPDWSAPEGSGTWLVYEQTVAPIIAEIPAPHFEQDQDPLIIITRDTINGIAVRAPGQITYEPGEVTLTELDSIAEAYYAISFVSTNSYLGINFDNDIFSNTDYYYTNGIRFDLVAPIFASSPFAWPMLPYRKESMNYHGMTIVQNMYTPTNPDTISVIEGDRPFAAYIYFGHHKTTLSKKRRYRQYSEIILGLIGPGSLGGFVQSQIHNIEPVGWENQIQNDLVLNYTAVIEKGIFNPAYFDLNVFADGQIGTLYDNIGAGIRLRAGKLNPYFSMPNLATSKSIEGKDALNLQYGFLASSRLRVIIYDATLQGGVFNPNNNYTISASDIERLVLQASVGIYFAYKQLGLTYEHFYISPEFENAKNHQWGHLNLTYCF